MKTKPLIVILALLPAGLSAQGHCSSVLWNATLDSHGAIVRSWGAMQATMSKSHFTSADILSDPASGNIDLVEAGHGRWYLQHIPTAGPGTAGCPASDIINVDIIPDLPPVPIPYSTTPDSPMFGPTTWPMTLSPVPVSTTCYSTR